MNTLQRSLCALCLLLTPLQTLAWGKVGHEIVGDLAQRQLNAKAQAEVSRLLAAESDPTLSGIAMWADNLRSSDADLFKKTSHWHYINFPRGVACEFVPARDCPDGNCVIAAINRNFTILSDKKRSDAERTEALKFLVHFIGDVHQPFHAGYGDDRGGNSFQISYQGKAWKPLPNPKPGDYVPSGWNIHSVWDSMILESKTRDSKKYAAMLWKQSPLAYDETKRSDRPAVDWAMQSCSILRDNPYPAKNIIKDDYLDKYRPLQERRLREAGARLAAMINYALGR
ncbi:MAG: S1/P1 nuclease [Arenimonas sp.]